MLKAIARPKVNLFLHVTGRRADGYHLLESLVVFPEGGDEVTIAPHTNLSLNVTGQFSAAAGNVADNLILKAAALLRSKFDVAEGAMVDLKKSLPVAAGIGGGSADAAVTLRLLNELWRLGLPPRKIAEIGLELGADIPVCLLGRPALMSGIGEKLMELTEFPKLYIILVNYGIKVSTAEVFRRLSIPSNPAPAFEFNDGTAEDLISLLAGCRNDLQAPALAIAPEISVVLSALEEQEGCQLARMSGSGGTCFGIFETIEAANLGARQIQTCYPDWWVYPTVVCG